MGANIGGVDQHTLDVVKRGVVREQLEQLSQAAAGDPTSEPIVYRVPSSEFAGQVSPRNPRSRPEQYGLKEHSFRKLRLCPAFVSFGLLDTRLHRCPEFVRDHVPHGIRASGEVDVPFSTSTVYPETARIVNSA